MLAIPWEALHPFVVAFVIGLFGASVLFVLLATLLPLRGRGFSVSALILLLCGIVATLEANATGTASAERVRGVELVQSALQKHEGMAELALVIFAVLTGIYAVVVVLPIVVRQLAARKFLIPANAVFLLLLIGANAWLAKTAYQGTRLVHQFGIHVRLPAEPADEELAPPLDQR